MATNFPTSLDVLTNPVNGDVVDVARISTAFDAIEAIEARVGITGSADAVSLTKRIAVLEAAGGGSGEAWLWRPSDQGFLSWTFDPGTATSVNPAYLAGRLVVTKMRIPAGTVTNICLRQNDAAVPTGFYAALYNSSKALLAQSANVTALFTGVAGMRTIPLSSPQVVAAGTYWVAFWFTGATTPNMFACNDGFVNLNATGASARTGNADTGVTTTAPNPFGVTTGPEASNYHWVGLT